MIIILLMPSVKHVSNLNVNSVSLGFCIRLDYHLSPSDISLGGYRPSDKSLGWIPSDLSLGAQVIYHLGASAFANVNTLIDSQNVSYIGDVAA